MREFSELPIDQTRRRAALTRVRQLIWREQQRRRRRRFTARAVAAGLTLFMVLTVAPKGSNQDLQPLLGLADAVEQLPRQWSFDSIEVWYSKVDRVELVQVPLELTGGIDLEFLLPSTEESWYGIEGIERKRVTYGEPEFLSPEGARVFWSADLSDHYPTRRIAESEQSLAEMAFMEGVAEGPVSDLRAVLERQVAGRGDRRLEEVEMLRLSARLMQTYGADPMVRSTVLRVIADIPGINVGSAPGAVEVWFDYVDGDRPLRLSYAFDADTAHLVRESLATLATQSEPSSFLEWADYSPAEPAASFVGA